ncbi:metallophosphoesterase family protein [Candidatus Alkanophaga liquidiphilum]|nr:MAG: serine/threonine protein phosphatase [Candidatus Alkanophagales archaeon]
MLSVDCEELKSKVRGASSAEFSRLVDEVSEVLKAEGERRGGSGLVELAASGKLAVVGDIHGDLRSLLFILNGVRGADKILFLGDYGDRGDESVEVYLVILELKRRFGDAVILLRGNHEGPPDLQAVPHDLPLFFRRKYGGEGVRLYEKVRAFWELLPFSAMVKRRYLFVHGGVPTHVASKEDIAFAHEMHPQRPNFEEILWSDPAEGQGSMPSFRGAGQLFGEDVTERALSVLGVRTLIRSHEPCDGGVEVRQHGKVLTVFSRKGMPYMNRYAAYLLLDATEPAKDAYELVRASVRF